MNKTLIILFSLLLFSCGDSKMQHHNILVFGDSLVAGYGLSTQDSFPAQLSAELKKEEYDVTIYNEGISGNTTLDGKNRIDKILESYNQIDRAIVVLGANDILILGRDPRVAKIMEENLGYILQKLQEKNIKILLCGIVVPEFSGVANSSQIASVYESLSKKYNTILYKDFLGEVRGQSAYNLADQLHPNGAGIALIVKDLTPKIIALLK